MAYNNNMMFVRYRLLAQLVKMWKDNEIVEKIDEYIEKIGGTLPEKDRLIFYKGLRTISKNLEKVCEGFEDGDGTE